MAASTCAGLAVTAHNNASNCVATFENVSFNQPPLLAPILNQTILAGRTLSVTNTANDADISSQTLSFYLASAPAGAAINTNNGLFAWRPAIAQSPSTQTVAVAVSDNGVPPMSATQSFTVIVTRPNPPTLSAPTITNGQFAFWFNGDSGPDYAIQTSTNLSFWSPITNLSSPLLPLFWIDTGSGSGPVRFYRVMLGP
jgi:hypothetical protein